MPAETAACQGRHLIGNERGGCFMDESQQDRVSKFSSDYFVHVQTFRDEEVRPAQRCIGIMGKANGTHNGRNLDGRDLNGFRYYIKSTVLLDDRQHRRSATDTPGSVGFLGLGSTSTPTQPVAHPHLGVQPRLHNQIAGIDDHCLAFSVRISRS